MYFKVFSTLLVSFIFALSYLTTNVAWAQNNSQSSTNGSLVAYDFPEASKKFHAVEIPDFLALATGKATSPDSIVLNEHLPDTLSVTYFGSYSDDLKKYANILQSQGFTALINGYEGYYSLEKNIDGYLLQIAAYHLNEVDGVRVDITATDQSSQLSLAQIEAEISRIRKIYNEIMDASGRGLYVKKKLPSDVTVYIDENEDIRRIDIPRKDPENYGRFYYFENNTPIFAFLEGQDSHRLYFHQGKLFRNRYTNHAGKVVTYDYPPEFENLATKVKDESREIFTEFGK